MRTPPLSDGMAAVLVWRGLFGKVVRDSIDVKVNKRLLASGIEEEVAVGLVVHE